ASGSKSVDVWPPDEAGAGTERHGLQHVRAAADAAVHEDLHAPTCRLDDRRQDVDGGRHAIELAAAVVGDDNAVDAVFDHLLALVRADDALDQQRPLPDTADEIEVLPRGWPPGSDQGRFDLTERSLHGL